MAKKTNTTKTKAERITDDDDAPDLDLPAPAAPSGGMSLPGGGFGVGSMLDEELAGIGFATPQVGGSLPLITFPDTIGASLLCTLLGYTPPEQEKDEEGKRREFGIAQVQPWDQGEFVTFKGDLARCTKVSPHQLVASYAIRDYVRESDNWGKLIVIRYQGKTPTRRGQSDLKLYSIQEVTKPA